MRKSGLFLSLLAASTIASASTYDYEFTPVAGGVWTEGNLGLKNETLFGGEFQFNNLGDDVKPELSVYYTPDAKYENSTIETDIYRVALNGVYEYGESNGVIPFAKMGVGYETIDDRLYDNRDSAFGDLGAGVKIPLAKQIALKLEAIYMLKYNDDRWDNNLAGLVGVTFAFGESASKPAVQEAAAEPEAEVREAVKTEPAVLLAVVKDSDKDGVPDYKDSCTATPTGVKVDEKGCPLDSDSDGVADANDECPNTPSGVSVDTKGCALDSDKDGIADHEDKCQGTPEGFKVDTEGCPVKLNLALTYEFGSDKIDAASALKVQAFAAFLKDSPAYKMRITGHTDSVGSEKGNQLLSEKRALSVRNMLVENGVDAARITTEGKGESAPIADNTTKDGRDANRRIEVDLLK